MEQGLAARMKRQLEELRDNLPPEAVDMLNTVDLLPGRLGCKPFDATDQDELLIIDIAKFIVEGYRGMSAIDVQAAFKLASKRELIFNGKVVEPVAYGQKLNTNLVGLVLTAYVSHCNALRASVATYQPRKAIAAPVQEPMTNKSAYDLLIELCGESKEFPAIFGLWRTVYDYLIEEGLLDDWPESRIKDLRAKAKLTLSTRPSINRSERLHDEAVDSLSKELIAREYLKDQGFTNPKNR